MGSAAGYEGLQHREEGERYKTLIHDICSRMISESLYPSLLPTTTNIPPATANDIGSAPVSSRPSSQDRNQTSASDNGYMNINQENSTTTY